MRERDATTRGKFYRTWDDGDKICRTHATHYPCRACEIKRREPIAQRRAQIEREAEAGRDERHREEMERMWVERDSEYQQARRDLKSVKWKLRKMRCRRSRPWWSAPSELWRMLLSPKICTEHNDGRGIGWTEEGFDGTEIGEYLVQIFAMCRLSKAAPIIWHRAKAHSLHKKNR
jgi:hypothetical protein